MTLFLNVEGMKLNETEKKFTVKYKKMLKGKFGFSHITILSSTTDEKMNL